MQFSDRQLQISDRGDYGCSKISISPLNFTKMGITRPKFGIFRRKFSDRLKYRGRQLAPLLPCHDAAVAGTLVTSNEHRENTYNERRARDTQMRCCLAIHNEMLLLHNVATMWQRHTKWKVGGPPSNRSVDFSVYYQL